MYYTVEEVSKILKCNKRTIYRGIQKGDIPYMKFGNLIRIPEEFLKPNPTVKGDE